MQNFDFYSGPQNRNMSFEFDSQDPEFYARTERLIPNDPELSRRRASRMLFIICAMCIIAFTTGLVIGIKFAGGRERELVDPRTSQLVTDVGSRMSKLVNREKATVSELYPREEYPWVVSVGNDFTKDDSRKLAEFLSTKGHTVILSRNGEKFRLFAGPFRSKEEAQKNLDELAGYKQYSLAQGVKILKR